MATNGPSNRRFEISGGEALHSRDLLEDYFTAKVPHSFQPIVSSMLTFATGIAATKYSGNPTFDPSLARETTYLLAAFAAGGSMIFGPWPVALLGSLTLIGAGRNLVSGTGHVLNHRCKNEAVRVGYDLVSALMMLPSWKQYKEAHWLHHVNTASDSDPDRILLDLLGVMPTDGWNFLRCVVSPRVHCRFLKVRARALFLNGQPWRAAAACLWWASLVALFPTAALWFFGAAVLGYPVTAIAALLSLHRWWSAHPEKKTAKSVAVAVTLGRLNLQPPTLCGVVSLLVNVAASAILHPGAGERNHDLHHGSWPGTLGAHCPYTRTALILAGTELRQTTSLGQMFKGALNAAREAQVCSGPQPIDDRAFLAF